MTNRRKIAIFTANRAEYGLLYPIIRRIAQRADLEYFLLVSGAHLQEDFGYTLKEIQRDGFTVQGQVAIRMIEDTLRATTHAVGTAILSLSRYLDEIKPDVLVVYGDRFEAFAAVITGSQMGIPTAHIEGGDLTEGGALDDCVRHAMTKLSHIHFTTNAQATERVRRLGEERWRVFNVGFPAIDLIVGGIFATGQELKERYDLDVSRPIILFTQHSVTTEFEKAADQVRPSLNAMKDLSREGCQVLITYPNSDAGGRRIIEEIEKVKKENLPNIQIHKSLGRQNYYGVLYLCGRTGRGVCVGNSSSGIKETPAFGCPAVNIGSRQNARLRSANVIDTSYDQVEIKNACLKALRDDSFRRECEQCENPYGKGDSGVRIAEALATIELGPKLLQKKMTY